ncbi:DUF1853 domain-containing protein, partial [Vibrio alginolyticus]
MTSGTLISFRSLKCISNPNIDASHPTLKSKFSYNNKACRLTINLGIRMNQLQRFYQWIATSPPLFKLTPPFATLEDVSVKPLNSSK